MDNPIGDEAQRRQALDPEHSFIVQAPAGSGKTELLIQRYLKLLSMVESPEEIIAITFTRKASAEMRSRVLQSLGRAADDTPPQKPHEYKTWELARAALHQNNRHQWMLTENPTRFKIQTIDSFCAQLTRQMPMISGFGAQPEITENPQALYRRAARNTIKDLESAAGWSPSIEALVRHLDNHLEKVENLIAAMLGKRDQWLRHVAGQRQRETLEKALANMVNDALLSVRRQFPAANVSDLVNLSRFAAGNLKSWGMDLPVCKLDGVSDLPGAAPEDQLKWLGISNLLLTKEGEWRKTANKNLGFPAPGSVKKGSALYLLYQDKKELFANYIQRLSGNETLASALHNIRFLPEAYYTDAQWDIMEALFELLLVAVGHLSLVFSQSGQVDFAEIALRAKNALGNPESPTDLTLALDFRIKHILVDEFQDTSFTQYELLERLTAGWTPGDGRTFFAVGDPMQSIYGFREAEVGLFLKAQKQGLGQIRLDPITLSVNFRSKKKIVDWINSVFPHVMPVMDDETIGAVSYSPSVALQDAEDGETVMIHPLVPASPQAEAEVVLRCVQEARASAPDDRIAILVRSRTHLDAIVPALKSAGLLFRSVEIESLKNRPVIGDLISLTRALSHPADRVAWLAVLRAPWCGLTLADLFALAGKDHQKTMLDLMFDDSRLAEASPDGQKRWLRVRQVLAESLQHRRRKTFRRQVEGVWLALGGPACISLPSDMQDVSVFFELLDQLTGKGNLADIDALETAAAGLFARPDAQADDTLQIMTIHKAKGLEFDTVILPGLEKTPASEDPQLLLWLERNLRQQSELLLAPIAETGGEPDRIYNYIKSLYEKKREIEESRVLYVAATRAKKRLHLMGGAAIGKTDALNPPAKKSLLAKLWPMVKEVFFSANPGAGREEPASAENNQPLQILVPYIRRFAGDFSLPSPPPDITVRIGVGIPETTPPADDAPLFDWAGETVRRSGTVIHQWLKIICEDGIDRWSPKRIESMSDVIQQDLVRSGISPDQVAGAAETVKSALGRTLTDERGRWILAAHSHVACEYALTGRIDHEIVNCIIDRTFMDKTGTRWIIDYKSGVHRGGSVDEFLDKEKMRYLSRMETYAQLMSARDKTPVRLGLYFPQLNGWREWEYLP